MVVGLDAGSVRSAAGPLIALLCPAPASKRAEHCQREGTTRHSSLFAPVPPFGGRGCSYHKVSLGMSRREAKYRAVASWVSQEREVGISVYGTRGAPKYGTGAHPIGERSKSVAAPHTLHLPFVQLRISWHWMQSICQINNVAIGKSIRIERASSEAIQNKHQF